MDKKELIAVYIYFLMLTLNFILFLYEIWYNINVITVLLFCTK